MQVVREGFGPVLPRMCRGIGADVVGPPGVVARRTVVVRVQRTGVVGRLVTEHLAEEISIESLAELVGLSSSHFAHVFKESTGMTPLQFVTRQRITRAQQLIRETSRNLIEVGLEVGYSSPSHFAQVFRRETGLTPRDYRRQR